jgi:hypothetical protein
LLELLVKCEPVVKHDGLKADPHRTDSYVNTYGGGDRPDNPKVWSVGRRKWTTRQISAVRPDLQPVLGSLLGELRESGLAQDNDTAPAAIKRLSGDLTKQVNRQAGQMQRSRRNKPMTLQESTIQLPDPTWSPTELGEKILGFYAEAGAEDSQGQATTIPSRTGPCGRATMSPDPRKPAPREPDERQDDEEADHLEGLGPALGSYLHQPGEEAGPRARVVVAGSLYLLHRHRDLDLSSVRVFWFIHER